MREDLRAWPGSVGSGVSAGLTLRFDDDAFLSGEGGRSRVDVCIPGKRN